MKCREKNIIFLNVSREWSYFERWHSKYSGRSRVIRGREGRREGRMGGRGGEGGSRAKPGNQLVYYITMEPSAIARWALSSLLREDLAATKEGRQNIILPQTTMTSLMSGNRRVQLIERKYGRHWTRSSIHWTRQATILVWWILLRGFWYQVKDSSVTIGAQQMQE